MYEIKNGILYKDGKKVYALGESYYPSFNPTKFPVPPEGDRYGEMKKDLKEMARCGFNHVRFAALGEVIRNEDGSLTADTPFIDEMTREAEKNGLSVSVRQQGFAVNLRDFPNVKMIDWNGVEQETNWADFIRTTLQHEGILEDNRIYAETLARHYAQFDNIVAYQIYNEPHYPGKQMYDYHSCTIEAYRKWLVQRQILTAEEAKTYEPPRGRKEQSPRMWALWRIFARDSLTDFLNNASDASHAGFDLPTYTCFTADQISNRNAYRGCDLFANAKAMDIVGYTVYIHAAGADYYPMCLMADTAQCAAELEGKESWCIELDSRTDIPSWLYNRGTYAVLGSGCKGIVYYQWRGDYPAPGVPHPNSCGLLNYDGTKTANYDNGVQVNRYIQEVEDLLVNARRSHDGVGLLHSDYAAFLCDAMENEDRAPRGAGIRNSYMTEYHEIYRQLRQAGYSVDILDAEHLDVNKFAVSVLYIPHFNMLAPEEQAAVDRFMERGGTVMEVSLCGHFTQCIGFKKFQHRVKTYEEKRFDLSHTVYDVAELTGVLPKAAPLVPGLGIQVLEGDGYTMLVLTNLSTVKREMDAKLQVNIPFKTAQFYAIDGKRDVLARGNELTVEKITDGGILVLR